MSVFSDRLERVIHDAARLGIDVTVMTHSTDFRYLTGYPYWCDERLLALVIPQEHAPFIIANQLYRLQVDPLEIADKVYWRDGEDPYAALSDHLAEIGVKSVQHIAVEDTAAAMTVFSLQNHFGNIHYSLASALINPLRQVKDSSEIKLLQEAANRAEQALQATLSRGTEWIGHTEREFEQELQHQLQLAGAPGSGLVAVGANAAQPHHVVDGTPIKENDLLLVDYGAEFHGYHSDETRTVFFGEPSKKFYEVYDIVHEAYQRGIAAAHVGNTLEDVDIAARAYTEQHGYGEYFTHRVGHGIGLDTHEGFSVNTSVKDPIVSGNVFSVEPGIYLSGELGVRIESLVHVNDEGLPELLHHLPTELRIIK